MASKKVIFVSGKLFWAKVLGDPRPNYSKDGFEWTFEFEPDAAGLKKIEAAGIGDKLKNKYEDRGRFLSLKRASTNKDGAPNTPIRVYDGDDQEWDSSKLIGNATSADVKLDIRDYGPGKRMGVYPVAIRVKELVQYQSSEFGAMDGDDAPAAKPKTKAKANFDLDDDIPF